MTYGLIYVHIVFILEYCIKLTIDCMVYIVCTGFRRRTEKVEIDFVLLITTKGRRQVTVT